MPLAPRERTTFNLLPPARGLSVRGWAIRSRNLVLFAATLATIFGWRAYGFQKTEQKEPAAPAVDFQAVVERDSVKRSEDVRVFCLITNKSKFELKNPKVTLLNPVALTPTPPDQPPLPMCLSLKDVSAFGTQRSHSDLKVGTDAEFAQHRLIFALDYTWVLDGKPMSSAQTTTLTLPVVRQFEEEAKGLPGGTAPILYMLMPIIPAILTYEFFNSLRKGEGAKMPQFKTEYIVPSFVLAVLLGFFSLFAARRNASVDYSSPMGFVIVTAISAALGSMIVGIQWVCDCVRWWRRGFKPTDSEETYLRKALLQCKDGKARWATGTVEGQRWQGVLLTQPDKTHVLGARMQISVKPNSAPSWDELIAAIDETGKIKDPSSLRRWLRQKKLTIAYVDKIKRAEENVDQPVATEGLESFTFDPAAAQPMKAIVRPVH